MKKWGINRIRESFSARLRIYVVGFTALLFILAFYVFFRFSYGFIRDEAMHRGTMYRDFEAHARDKACNLFKKEVE